MSVTELQGLPANELGFTRVINAPRSLVFDAWTNPESVIKWWGPDGFTTTVRTINIAEGGSWDYDMVGPDGTLYPNLIQYREIEAPQHLSYHHSEGNVDDPSAFDVTVTFEEWKEMTKITIRMKFQSAEIAETMREFGNSETFDNITSKLEDFVAEELAGHFHVTTRTIKAPRQLVFDCFTKPEHLLKWWGPAGMTMEVANVDLRPGGLYHYCLAIPNGDKMWGRFVYHQIISPELLSYFVSFSDKAGGITRHPMSPTWPAEMLSTAFFSEIDGITTLALYVKAHNASAEELATFEAGKSSMEQGFGGTFSQLEAYLANILD